MTRRLRFIVFATLVASGWSVLSAEAGLNPETGSYVFRNYTPKEYGAAPGNWAIAQDRRGVMYFGNDDGVLEFDGTSWRTIRLKQGAWVRALALDRDGTIYVGGRGDFGFLHPDAKGAMEFVSLLDKVPLPDREFSDVWRVLPTPEGVYFSAYNRLFRLNPDGSIKAWRPVSNFGRAFYESNTLFVKTREMGLLKVSGNELVPVPGGAEFAKLAVNRGVSSDNTLLIATAQGLYRLGGDAAQPFPTGADAWMEKNTLNTIRVLPEGEIAVGSRTGGLALIGAHGAIDRIVSKADGLPDDSIEAIFPDNQGGIWLARSNGITRFNPGLSRFAPNLGLEGNILATARQGNALYAGGSAGLFRLKTVAGQRPRFEPILGLEGAVRALLPHDLDLIAATDMGVYLVRNDRAARILQTKEPVFGLSASSSGLETIYAAGRAHVFALHRMGTAWTSIAFDAPSEEFRSALQDAGGKVWATSTNNIWRLDFTEQPVRAEKFGAAQGVPPGWVNARRLNGRIVFATSTGVKTFVESVKRFGPDIDLGSLYSDGSRDILSVFESPAGDVWVTGAAYQDLLRRDANGYKRFPMPLLSTGIEELLDMSLENSGVAWAVGTDKTLYRWEPALAGNPDNGFHVITRKIQTPGEKEALFGGDGPFGFAHLPWRSNELRFEFAAPFYEDPAAVEYQVRLDGSDRNWTAWNKETFNKYTHLSEGSYRFHVRARTPHGAMSEESAIEFGVLPPWYRTWWAYSFYAVGAVFGVWFLVRLRTKQLVADKHRLETIVEERTVEIREQRDEIQVQEQKSQSLLLNILPAAVADELKTTGAVKPVAFDDVTVCFTDFVGFTLSSEKMQAGSLVDALNEYFTRFDEIIARYGLEKLKTIGDSYMFASGLPTPRTSHAVDAVLAAMEMVEVVKELGAKTGGTGWNIRVGLHSGPVVAGVVGIRKFAFDIWGTTVNFAARMESSGVPGRVNMSERTCRLTRELIDCESRGHVRIKEGRELPMFLARAVAADFDYRYHAEFGVNGPQVALPIGSYADPVGLQHRA